jgi:hypothetical protein
MKAHQHALMGAAVGVTASLLPDVVLALYRWRGELHPAHPLARTHRFAHSPQGLIVVGLLCYAAHLYADWMTHPPHMYEPMPDMEKWFESELEWRATHLKRTR